MVRDEPTARSDAKPDFTSWVRPHWASMDRLARRLVGSAAAEDVLQNALASAWRSRARFDPDRGSARAWLLAIVANEARDHRAPTDLAAELPDVAGTDSESANVEALDLSTHLARLSPRQQLAVALYYYLRLPTEECAETMGCSVGTVKSTLSDARRRLRDLLGEGYR